MLTLDEVYPNMIIKNENYETDLKYDLELNRILLKSIGVWPRDSKDLTNFDRIVSLLTKLFAIFISLFFMIPCGCYIFFVEKDWPIRIQVLCSIIYCFEAFVKYTIAIARKDEIKFCIDMIALDWRQIDSAICRSIMLKNARYCRIFTILCVTITFFSITIYTFVVPFVSGRSDALEQNNTKHGPVIYGTEFYVFDAQISPMCEIVYVGQALAGLAMCAINCSMYTLTVKFVMHACSRYQIVIALLQYMDDDEIYHIKCQDEKQRKFADIIQRHLYAIEFVPRIESVLNEMCLVDLIGCTINICFVGYILIVEWDNSEIGTIATYIIGMMSVLSNIFVLCYIGEHLAEQCREVGMAGYMTNWWGMQLNQARALILVIAASDFPIEFTAGKMFYLSLGTFGAVIKAAMAYLNVLRTIVQDEE